MKNPNAKEQQAIDTTDLPAEAVQALKILDELENFTAELRKKLMSELKPGGNVIRLKLDNV
jgi:hypothetical protein